MTRRQPTLALALMVTAAIVVAGCSSSGSNADSSNPTTANGLPSTAPGSAAVDPDVATIIDLFAAPDLSGAIRGTTTVNGRSAPLRGRFSGTQLATDGRGTLTGVAPLQPEAPLDVAWRDGQLASLRTEGISLSVWPSPLVVQSVSAPIPPVGPMGIFVSSVEPVFPPALLARIQNRPADRDETITVDGQEARRATFSYSDPGFGRINRVTLTILDGPRLARVKVQSEIPDVKSTLDYGVTLSNDGPLDVQLPDGATTGPAPALAPEGAFVERRSGSAPGAEWRVLRAPGRKGIECWRVEATPPIAVASPNFEDARCLAKLSTKDDLAEQVEFVVTSDGSGSPAMIVARVPDGASKARLGFAGGKLSSVPIKKGLVVWAGDNTTNPIYLQLRLGGELVECGPEPSRKRTTSRTRRWPTSASARRGRARSGEPQLQRARRVRTVCGTGVDFPPFRVGER